MKYAAGAALLLVLATATASADIVAEYDFTGNTGAEELVVPVDLDVHALASNLSRGSGISPATLSDSFAASGWTGLPADDYFTFSIEPELGYRLDLASIDLGVVRSGGASTMELTWSGDGFSSALATVPLTTTATAQHIDFGTPLQILEQVEFRLRAVGLTDADDFVALTNIGDAPGLTLNASIASIPEPGSIVLLSLAGLATVGVRGARRWRRSSQTAA